VRDGNSDAYQQIHRVNPVLVDFKGPLAKRDRQRLLRYRIFDNRMQVPPAKIEGAIQRHLGEYFRLAKVPQSEQEKRQADFIEAWPFAPHLLKLLDDQVLIATDAQETRDLIKILVDLFENGGREPADHYRRRFFADQREERRRLVARFHRESASQGFAGQGHPQPGSRAGSGEEPSQRPNRCQALSVCRRLRLPDGERLVG
jgi:hypothetical protein